MFQRQKIYSIPDRLTEKWSAEVLNEGYTPFPKRLLRCMSQIFTGPHAMDDLRVVLSIADYKRPNLTRQPSYEFLGFVAGMDPKDFKERVEDLERRGLLKSAGDDDEIFIDMKNLIQKIVDATKDTETEV